MANNLFSPYQFDKQTLDCVVGGVSALDVPRLSVHSHAEAQQFIASYGYDINIPEHSDQLRAIHRRAVAFIRDQLLEEGEFIPEQLVDTVQIEDLTRLLITASSRKKEDRELQRWSCAILRVMHVFVHLRHDLFSAFRGEIQTQILRPLQEAIHRDETSGVNGEGAATLGSKANNGGISLHKFEIKPFKTTTSSVVKLLARPERVALQLLDKLGVRFVTHNIYDSFRVIQFLVESHLLSFPHIIPDQSNNTLYPVNLFLEVMDEIKDQEQARGLKFGSDQVQEMLMKHLEKAHARAEYLEKANQFSGEDYRFIKFINRKLVVVDIGQETEGASGFYPGEAKRKFGFFYPYEIQIMDHRTYLANLSGPMAHKEYKNRQIKKARERVLGGD